MENKTELETVLKLLDKIITSERAEIKGAFRELMIIAALTEPNADTAGPLMDLLDRVAALEIEVSSIKANYSRIPSHSLFEDRQYTWNNTSAIYGPLGHIAGTSGAIGGSPDLGSDVGKIADSWKNFSSNSAGTLNDMSFKNPEFTKMWEELQSTKESDKD